MQIPVRRRVATLVDDDHFAALQDKRRKGEDARRVVGRAVDVDLDLPAGEIDRERSRIVEFDGVPGAGLQLVDDDVRARHAVRHRGHRHGLPRRAVVERSVLEVVGKAQPAGARQGRRNQEVGVNADVRVHRLARVIQT